MTDKPLACIILAAGKGTRMKSRLPKVMHPLAGRPMLGHVLAAVAPLKPAQIIIVVAPGMEDVTAYAAPHQSVIQIEALGTAHAVQAAAEALKAFSGEILVVFGDEPLVDPENLRRLVAARAHENNPAVVMMGRRTKNPGAYGRLVMGVAGLERIVEALDASEQEKKIDLVWTGSLVADGKVFFDLLARIDNGNAKGEYYLTAIVAEAREAGRNCGVLDIGPDETIGINSRAELATAEAMMQKNLRDMAMAEGATLTDPSTIYFSADTKLGRDVVIGPNVVFGPNVTIGDNVQIKSFCHIEGASIADGAIIGPFARLRPGTVIEKDVHIGNFVEIKNALLHEGVKAGHLTYLGDAEIGAESNIGAGTITCNYDGFAKHTTKIGARTFIGSDTALVAPVTIGDDAIIGAGSVITKDVPADALAISRGQQRNLEGGAKAFRDKRKK